MHLRFNEAQSRYLEALGARFGMSGAELVEALLAVLVAAALEAESVIGGFVKAVPSRSGGAGVDLRD